jgi:peptide deformylase
MNNAENSLRSQIKLVFERILWYNYSVTVNTRGNSKLIKELMHDPIFRAGKSEEATKEDIAVANDLLETLMAHRESCVGMAANMIGVRKRIIAFLDESGRQPTYTVMLNPVILKKDKPYDTEEGCLSLLGGPRKCKRYKTIKVQYQTLEMQTRTKNYEGWTAQIIQHEVDHCNGVLI